MSAEQKPEGTPKRPTPEDLAGIPFLISDEEVEEKSPRISPPDGQIRRVKPTPEDLAGIMACPEGIEDTTIRPRKKA